ncbi:MAG: NTP transferase domain-containing protein [Planctomycetes bacterium]|nr:NTP transferase domain-containing protein [Planctomycetota bacterium]
MPVVILCGGKGTRLGDAGKLRPKPLVPIGGMPILWHIMKAYAHHGHKEFVLCLGYKGEMVEEVFTRGTIGGEPACDRVPSEPDWRIVFADTGPETGTSGRVFKIERHVQDADRFFLTYGDGVSSVRIDDLLGFHLRKGRVATVTGVRPETTFGVIREEDGIATAFAEKPRLDVIINGGFFVMERAAFRYLDEDGPLEDRPLRRLTEKGQLAVYRHEGFWQCMDNQKEVEKLNGMWARKERPWAVWETSEEKHRSRESAR